MPIVQAPRDPADAQVAQLQHLFNRVLQSWALDVLALRKRGLDRPSLRVGEWELERSGQDDTRRAA